MPGVNYCREVETALAPNPNPQDLWMGVPTVEQLTDGKM